MLVTFKTISQQVFKLQLEDTDTVAEVKQKIANEKGEKDFSVEHQKLIYNGKILEDSQTVGELSIDEKKFVVVMVSRKKNPEAESSSSAEAKPAESSTSESPSAQKKEATPATNTSTPLVVDAAGASDSLEVPDEHKETVENILSMGYPREEVIRAMKAAFFNADRAVEYLCNGIPDIVSLRDPPALAAAQGAGGESDAEDMEEGAGLEFLQNSPQFQQLRDLVRANPTMFPEIITQIANSNPDLMNIIRDHQAEFLELINIDATVGEPVIGGGEEAEAVVAGGAAPQIGGGGGAGAPRVLTINVTENDRNAIQRLQLMGFPEQLVIEAYFACDKDENQAVNYIMDRMAEGDEGAN